MKHILVVPAWYDVSDPLVGIFFHEFCNSVSAECKVTLLDFKIHSFSDNFKSKKKEDRTSGKKYGVLSVDFYNPFPGKWFGLSAYLQRQLATKQTINAVKAYAAQNGAFDLVHIQSVCNNLTPVISVAIARDLGVPYLVTEHYTGFKEAGESMFVPFTSFREINKIVNEAPVRIGVSTFASKFCEEVFCCPFDTVHNIISSDFINRPLIPLAEKNDFNFICIGAFKQRKGQQYLIRAFAKIIDQYPDMSLTFVGGGAERDNAMNLASELGVRDKIKLASNISAAEYIELLDACSVLVSASDKELFGLTIVEAFFRGKPAIATRSGGPEDLISDENGLMCNFADVDDMARLMRHMYENYSSYDPKKIRNQAIARFSEGAIVPLMMSKYEQAQNLAVNIGKKT